MSEPSEMSCEQLADVAAELALGVLTGRERAQALAHLDQCDGCREYVRQLTETGEELVGLLPAAEPPAGFETRVLARIGIPASSPPPPSALEDRAAASPAPAGPAPAAAAGGHAKPSRRRPMTRRMLATAAAVVALAVAALGGWGLRAATTPAPVSQLSAAALVSVSHRTVGQIYQYSGNPGWIYMSVDLNSGSRTVLCQVVSATGKVTTVGAFRVTDGYGSWGSPDPAGRGTLAGARLVTAGGTVLATAHFHD